MAIALVIALTGTPGSAPSGTGGAVGSGATGDSHPPLPPQARELTAAPRVAPDSCPSARRAVHFYARRLTQWRAKMGAGAESRTRPQGKARSLRHATVKPMRACPRYLAHVLQRKAARARLLYLRWSREWEWQKWLPAKFYRVAHCETHVDWHFDSGTYVSAFGIIRVAYESMHPWTGHNSPREQYEVASSIQRRYGWSAWGCGGA